MAIFIFVLTLLATQFLSSQVHEDIPISEVERNEDNLIIQFRALMGDELYRDYMKSDIYLRRWLRVNDFNLDKASKNLRKTLQWRKDNKIDSILEEELKENKPYTFYGVDFEGSTVIIGEIAQFDTRALVLAGKGDIQVRAFSQMLETAETTILKRMGLIGNSSNEARASYRVKARNTPLEKLTVIADAHGYNLRQHACTACVTVYLTMFQILELHYPGYVKIYLFINVPRIFHPLLEMAKPLLSEEHRKAIRVFGVNKAEWINEFRKIVPMDQTNSHASGNLL